jgi:hypothetical protein
MMKVAEINSQHENDVYWRGWNEAVDACAATILEMRFSFSYPDGAAYLIVHEQMLAERMKERLRHRNEKSGH